MQFRLDKEGREFHHYDDFCQLYRAEILNLNRILDALVRNGVLPSNFIISTGSQVYSLISIDTKPINVKSFHAGYHRLLFCSSIFKTKTPQILNLQEISKLVHRGACPGAPGARPFLPCCTFPLCGLVLPCWPADRMEGSPPPPAPPASHEPTVTRGW